MGSLHGQLLYFAYGADMRHDVFAQRCPGSDWLGAARMEGQRFVLNSKGRATARPEDGATVWGALWLVPADGLGALDELAGVADGHCERTTRRIISPAGPRTEAMMYIGPEVVSAGETEPGYMKAVIAGAKENRLPAAYIKELQTWAAAKD